MSTIIEVAKRASVSIATVSNVIRGTKRVSPKLRERVENAIKELDYSPNAIARGLEGKADAHAGNGAPRTLRIRSSRRLFAAPRTRHSIGIISW